MNKVLLVAIGLFVGGALVYVGVTAGRTVVNTLGMAYGDENTATTTVDMTAGTEQPITYNRQTVLSKIVVASSSAGTLIVKNATSTTDVSSTTVTTLKASIGEGTYEFDAVLPRGLIVLPSATFDGDYVILYK